MAWLFAWVMGLLLGSYSARLHANAASFDYGRGNPNWALRNSAMRACVVAK